MISIPAFRRAAAVAAQVALLLAPGSTAAQPEGEAAVSRGWPTFLAARQEYWLRAADSPSVSDQQLHLTLDASSTSPEGAFATDAGLDLWWAAHDTRPQGESGPLEGLGTARAGRPGFLALYRLSAERRDRGLLDLARLGRQPTEHGRPATFDGAYLLLRPNSRLDLFAFGGRTERFFSLEGSNPLDNWLGSVGLTTRPASDLKVELDYRLLREKIADRQGTLSPVVDHSYGLQAFWRRGDWARTRLRLRGLGAAVSEIGAAASLASPASPWGAELSAKAQPVALGEHAESENPFFVTLGQSLPHARWRADLFRQVVASPLLLQAHLGYEGRQLLSGEEGPFNRNSSRAYLLLDASRIDPVPGLRLSASLDRISSAVFPFRSGERGLWALNGSAALERGPLRAEAGTQYHRYRYTYYRDLDETADVRLAFGELRWAATGALNLHLRYAAEVSDRTTHYLTFGLTESLQRSLGGPP